jgi:hypothetical protein
MLIIAALALALFLFVSCFIRSEERTPLACVLALILLWCIGWLAVVQFEAMGAGEGSTYGSDAGYYFDRMTRACRDAAPFRTAMESLSGGYVAFGTLVLLTSPFESDVWVKLANILCLVLALSFIYWLLRERDIRPRVSLLVLSLMGFNGIITWMALRNLKDTLFITACLLEIIALYRLLCHGESTTRRNIALSVFLALAFGYMTSTIRPWGAVFSAFILVSMFLGASFEGRVRRADLFLTLLVGGGLFFISIGWFARNLEIFRVYQKYNEESSELITALPSATQMLLIPARFLMGPGIVRALYPDQAFRVTTTTGNVLIFLGSLVWWSLLPILFLALTRPVTRIVRNLAVTGPALLFLCVYSYVYAGTADTRTRAVFYLLSAPLIGSYMEETCRCSPSSCQARVLTYSALLVVLVCLGTIVSYKTLG